MAAVVLRRLSQARHCRRTPFQIPFFLCSSSSYSSTPSPSKHHPFRFPFPSEKTRTGTSPGLRTFIRSLHGVSNPPGMDFQHWLVVMKKPTEELDRDQIISTYIKTLAMVLGSEEQAKKSIYSVSTRHYYAFGCDVSESISNKIYDLPGVLWVVPDFYLDKMNGTYGGEPFIEGKAVPYDPKYHAAWLKIKRAEDLRERIMQARQSKNLTRVQLAKVINEKTQVIIEYESGEVIPDQQIITKLEKALGVNLG